MNPIRPESAPGDFESFRQSLIERTRPPRPNSEPQDPQSHLIRSLFPRRSNLSVVLPTAHNSPEINNSPVIRPTPIRVLEMEGSLDVRNVHNELAEDYDGNNSSSAESLQELENAPLDPEPMDHRSYVERDVIFSQNLVDELDRRTQEIFLAFTIINIQFY